MPTQSPHPPISGPGKGAAGLGRLNDPRYRAVVARLYSAGFSDEVIE